MDAIFWDLFLFLGLSTTIIDRLFRTFNIRNDSGADEEGLSKYVSLSRENTAMALLLYTPSSASFLNR